MSYHPRMESTSLGAFLTTRCRNSRLWFRNNAALEKTILGYAAKFEERYKVTLYALAIEGNHIHGTALFPLANRASFMRDLNSCIARAVPRHTPHYSGGGLWGRRYSVEFLPGAEDVENQFFYTVLQPVNDGLVEKLSDYPGYNCFHDAIYGIQREFSVVRWGEYNAAKKRRKNVCIKEYTDKVKLRYERLPGYENLTQREYALIMLRKLEERRQKILQTRKALGLSFAGKEVIKNTRQGALPISTKISAKTSYRPRVLSECPERKRRCLSWYFDQYVLYRLASHKYRQGELLVKFPPGMYKPYLSTS